MQARRRGRRQSRCRGDPDSARRGLVGHRKFLRDFDGTLVGMLPGIRDVSERGHVRDYRSLAEGRQSVRLGSGMGEAGTRPDTCPQFAQEAQAVSTRTASLSDVQTQKRTNNSPPTPAPIVIFWPAAFFVG